MDDDALPPTAPVKLHAVLSQGHLSQAFDMTVATLRLHHVRQDGVRSARDAGIERVAAVEGLEVVATAGSFGTMLVLARGGSEREVAEVTLQPGATQIRTAADTPDAADELLARIADVLREETALEDPRVPVWFWTSTDHGPEPMRRRLHAPAWSEIAHNYVAPVRDALDRIMGAPPKQAAGIALWRGAPGTGKTTALRSLAREWRDDVEVHVIVDPEVFLGDRASYLVQVLFGDEVDETWDHGDDAAPMPSVAEAGRPAAKLIVLEDAGELISSDARVSAGQALSRLLNLTDGMLGQGANVSVLVTTNEPIDRLHPAVARAGRSWAHVEFRSLPADEANAWLERHGSGERVSEPATIAELYGVLRGDQVVTFDTLEE